MHARNFVDCHSHVVPSGDDGAGNVREGAALCREAARRGTAILFATPHVWPQLPLTATRERELRKAYAAVAERTALELRLGFELTPDEALLREEPARYELEGTGAVLVEALFAGPQDLLFALAEHVEAAGLQPVVAHPERAAAVLADPGLANALAEREWLLQVNGSSLLGSHGEAPQRLGWKLLEQGRAALVASDGHRDERPPHLDAAYRAACERLGEDRARPLFDGSALGFVAANAPTASRVATRGA